MSARTRYSRDRSGRGGAVVVMRHLVVALARCEIADAREVGRQAYGTNRGAAFVAIYEFDGYRPVVHESAFVHPQAAVTGNVVIGRDVYVGPGAAIRADWGEILIGDGCNVQEGCTIHVFPGATVTLAESAHVGHGAIIHGATIGRNTLVGMNAVVMDGARVVEVGSHDDLMARGGQYAELYRIQAAGYR